MDANLAAARVTTNTVLQSLLTPQSHRTFSQNKPHNKQQTDREGEEFLVEQRGEGIEDADIEAEADK